MEIMVLLVEAALVAGLGVWMTVAVYDNWRHAALNRNAVAAVMQFDLMARDFPDDYAVVKHRRIASARIIDLAFKTIRWAESLAAGLLLLAAGLLVAAAFGVAPSGPATALALGATAFFSLIWAGFIIGGNYFHYYYCHQWGQSNHFMFMYWGLFVLAILMI